MLHQGSLVLVTHQGSLVMAACRLPAVREKQYRILICGSRIPRPVQLCTASFEARIHDRCALLMHIYYQNPSSSSNKQDFPSISLLRSPPKLAITREPHDAACLKYYQITAKTVIYHLASRQADSIHATYSDFGKPFLKMTATESAVIDYIYMHSRSLKACTPSLFHGSAVVDKQHTIFGCFG